MAITFNERIEDSQWWYFYDLDDNSYSFFKQPIGFDNLELVHGFNTGWERPEFIYRGIEHSVRELMENPGWHLCCSRPGHHVGNYGAIVKGTHIAASNRDLGSFLNSNKHRMFDAFHDGIIQYTFQMMDIKGLHAEHIIKDFKVLGLWYALNPSEDITDIVEEMKSFVDLFNIGKSPRNKLMIKRLTLKP